MSLVENEINRSFWTKRLTTASEYNIPPLNVTFFLDLPISSKFFSFDIFQITKRKMERASQISERT